MDATEGTGSLRDLLYDYSLRDNLTSVLDLVTPGENATYGYDPRQMLESADGPWGALDWTYDPVGNRETQSLVPSGGGSASLDLYSYAVDANRLTRIDNAALGTREFGHDTAGNTTEELRALPATEDWRYIYDAMGRLASVTLGGSPVADYAYNALGQQVSRTVHFGGGTAAITLSVHDLNGNRLSEHDSGGVVLREYIWLDGRPLAIIEAGQTYWLHWDQIGRPVMATDASGTVVWAASYLPFGGIREVLVDTGVVGQDLRFPGQWFQAETGLHQNWHRDYDPTTGRYLQADPLGLVDGPSVYGYARQNPVKFTDPTGEFIPLPVIGALVGGLTNAGFQFLVNFDNTGDVMAALRCIDIGKVVASAAFGAIQFTPIAIFKQGGGVVKAGLSIGVTTAYKITQLPPIGVGDPCECKQQNSAIKEIITNLHL